LSRISRRSITCAVFLAALLFNAAAGCAAQASAAGPFDFKSADFLILSPDGQRVLGRSHFHVDRDSTGMTLGGENRYLDGQFDVETDHLTAQAGDALPRLITFNHSYFNADGSPQENGRADLNSGAASCTNYRDGVPNTRSATIKFPDDTWAGASLFAPLQRFLTDGAAGALKLHVYSCTPNPRLLTLEASIDRSAAPWPVYRGDALRVDLKPKLAWWDLIIRPFLPHFHAWFDPTRQFRLVGAQLGRYYRGPEIILVEAPPPAPAGTPPAIGRQQ